MRVIHDFLTCRLPIETADAFRRLAAERRLSVSAASAAPSCASCRPQSRTARPAGGTSPARL
jgi:hypothetical protein